MSFGRHPIVFHIIFWSLAGLRLGVEGARTAQVGCAWPKSEQVIVDLPAGLLPNQSYHQACDADSTLIPIVAELRDSQNYVHAAAGRPGIVEMPHYRVSKDIDQLDRLFGWPDRWRTRRLDGLIGEEIRQIRDVEVTDMRISPTH